MNHEKQLTFLTASVLAFLTAWGAGGCFLTAFSLTPGHGWSLPLACGIAALGGSFLFSLRRGNALVLCILALGAGYLYRDGTFWHQLCRLARELTEIYNRAYGLGVLALPEGFPAARSYDWPLGVWAGLCALAVSRSICCRKSVWLPMLVILLPLSSCIVVTDTVPRERWLMLLMAGLILLLLTASVRRENGFQGLWLTAAAAPPVVLGLVCLFLAVPQEGYVNQSATLRENILIAAENLPQLLDNGLTQLADRLQPLPPRQVDLQAVGSRIPFTYPVMTVTAQEGGMLYLRGQDYDRYDGLHWSASENRSEAFFLPGEEGSALTVSLEDHRDFAYLPYYPGENTTLLRGCAETGGSRDYTLTRRRLPPSWRETAYGSAPGTGPWESYLSLPETTRQAGQAYLEGLYPQDASNTRKADLIAALVTDCAQYDLNPGMLPEGEEDFALWFLREGDRGYCIHFATAATVLLRCAGVPARYVTGYLAEVPAGVSTTLTEENAHAWAEYYEPGLDLWLPLEATPAQDPVPEAQTPPAAAPETVPPPETEASLPPEPQTPPPSAPQPSVLPGTSPEAPAPGIRLRSFLPLLFLILAAAALAGQRSLRLKLRHRRQHTGDPNRQALQRWRESERLARLLKESPPEELMALAQKAKFSQHTLTQEELMQFDSFNRSCLRRLREKPNYLRWIYQYIYAAF